MKIGIVEVVAAEGCCVLVTLVLVLQKVAGCSADATFIPSFTLASLSEAVRLCSLGWHLPSDIFFGRRLLHC
jgi:hypothetical protein